MVREEGICQFCHADFIVEFEDDADELQFCPSCGEYLVEEDDIEELDFDEDEWE